MGCVSGNTIFEQSAVCRNTLAAPQSELDRMPLTLAHASPELEGVSITFLLFDDIDGHFRCRGGHSVPCFLDKLAVTKKGETITH